MDKPTPFVENWNIVQNLGNGAFGDVKLLINQETGQAVAVKIINLQRHKDHIDSVMKEERIHKLLSHPNIIRLFGKREEPEKVYIFLEYAAGGELFNKIEPDVGMPPHDAQHYMRQLLSAIHYLHIKGVTHRDIKPENILLDDKNNVKLSDFGMATIFRLRGKIRLMDKKCGTLPYAAPEVLTAVQNPYHAEPADLWSCGIVLLAMLGGELPWDESTDASEEYKEWKRENGLLNSPWCKVDTLALSLIRKMLSPEPEKRPKIEQIINHPFLKYNVDNTAHDNIDDNPGITLSQPEAARAPEGLNILLAQPPKSKDKISFSQPTNNENLIINSQLQFSQSPMNNFNFQKLIKRMTRFFVVTDYKQTVKSLCAILDKLHYTWTVDTHGTVVISTVDSRKMTLVFRANFITMDGKLLLDFQLSRGCGLEFKKKFVKIKELFADLISPSSAT